MTLLTVGDFSGRATLDASLYLEQALHYRWDGTTLKAVNDPTFTPSQGGPGSGMPTTPRVDGNAIPPFVNFPADYYSAAIQLAINAAPGLNCTTVWIPRSMLPFNPNLMTFNNTVHMSREGGSIRADDYDIEAYGAWPDSGLGTYDSGPGIQQACNAAANNGGIVQIPAGFFSLMTGLTLNAVTDFGIQGGGQSASVLYQAANNVNILNFTGVCSRVRVRDFGVYCKTGSSFAIGSGLSIIGTVGTSSDTFLVENLTIQNMPTPVFLQYCNNSNFHNIHILQNLAGAVKGQVWHMDNCISDTVTELLVQLPVGTYPSDGIVIDHDCDSVRFDNCEVLGCTNNGWKLLKSAGTTGPRLIKINHCYSESNTLDGFNISDGRDIRLNNCHAAVNGNSGFDILGGTSITLTNSLSLQNQQHGILVQNSPTGVHLLGNTCSNNSQQTNVTYHGISIQAPGVRCIGNRSGDFVFTLANKQAYGIALGNFDFITVMGNDLQGNTTGALANFTPNANCITSRNLGVTPSGVAAITVTASPFTYTNVDGVPEAVYITGGTVTTVAKNAITVYNHGGTAVPGDCVWLEPNESMTVTYTVAPTMNKDRK